MNTTYTDAKIYSVVLETETSVGDLEAGFLTWEMNMTLSDPNTFRTDATGTWFMLPYNDFQPMTSGSGSDSTGVKMARGAKKKRLSFRCKS